MANPSRSINDWRPSIFKAARPCRYARSCRYYTKEERDAIQAGLDAILAQIEAGEFSWDPELEDVHMNIEQALHRRCPQPQSSIPLVVVTIRWLLICVSGLNPLVTNSIFRFRVTAALVDLADQTQEVIIPGYTHLQGAQPVPMAHHLLAYVEMLARDRTLIAAAKEQANVCPSVQVRLLARHYQSIVILWLKSLALLITRAVRS